MNNLKRSLYFPVAFYFRFFAGIMLWRWKPRIIVVTGSSGKTTLLNLVESQLQEKAKYSHQANSSFGIPFNILGLKRKKMLLTEWPMLFLKTPIFAFKEVPKEKIYVVEADCERPGEGSYFTSLSSFLKPEVTLWVSVGRTHTVNFDHLVGGGKFPSVEEAVAYEFGYFLEKTKKLAIINGDSLLMKKQLGRTKASVIEIKKEELSSYQINSQGTQFKFGNKIIQLRAFLPEEVYYSIRMTLELLKYLGAEMKSFENFTSPPGRSSLFEGIKKTTIIDSSYNSNLDSMAVVAGMFAKLPGETKWAVIGDMLELGKEEKEEHERLASLLANLDLERLILMGPRVSNYTYPLLLEKVGEKYQIVTFENPKQTLEYLKEEIKGGEVILFKGARFLEGVIENLLLDKTETKYLARREEIWEKRRKQWGL